MSFVFKNDLGFFDLFFIKKYHYVINVNYGGLYIFIHIHIIWF